MKKFVLKVSIVLISILVALLLTEIILRIFFNFSFKAKNHFPFRTPVLYKLSKSKKLVYEMRPNSQVKIEEILYKTNNFGYRDKFFLPTNEKKRIIIIGDSVTFGWNVKLEDTYHRKTQQLLKLDNHDVEIMSMGMIGYNTTQEYFLIKEKALLLKPDVIILQICLNDYKKALKVKVNKEGRFQLTKQHYYSIPYLTGKTGLSEFFMKNSFLFKFLNLKIHGIIKKKNKDFSSEDYFLPGQEISIEYIKKIKKLTEDNGIKFLAVVFPVKTMHSHFLSFYKRVCLELDKIKIPYLDLHPILKKERKEKIWVDRFHPSSIGHKIVSESLSNFIITNLESDVENNHSTGKN